MKFNFTGVIKKPKKWGLQNVGTGDWRGLKTQIILDCGDFGDHYVTFFGGDFRKAKKVGNEATLSFVDKKMKIGDRKDPKEVTITYEERFKKEILNQLPDYRKRSFSMLGGEKIDYLFDTDFINEVYNKIELLEGKRFNVSGDFFINPNVEKGIQYRELRVSNLREVEENEDNPLKAEIMGKLIYSQTAIDPSFFDTNGNLSTETIEQFGNKIPVSVFMEMPVQNKAFKGDNPTCLIPITTKIDTTSVDFKDQDDVDLLTMMANLFKDIPTGKMMEWDFISDIYNKREITELSAEDIEAALTPAERMMAMLAQKKLAKRGLGGEKRFDLDKVALKKQNKNMYGDKIEDIILVVPNGIPEESSRFSLDMTELYKIFFKKEPQVNKKSHSTNADIDWKKLQKKEEAPVQGVPKPVIQAITSIEQVASPVEQTINQPAVQDENKPAISGNPAFQALFGAKK